VIEGRSVSALHRLNCGPPEHRPEEPNTRPGRALPRDDGTDDERDYPLWRNRSIALRQVSSKRHHT
jgi:hypothetical protein